MYEFQAPEAVSFSTEDEANDYAMNSLAMPWIEERERLKAERGRPERFQSE